MELKKEDIKSQWASRKFQDTIDNASALGFFEALDDLLMLTYENLIQEGVRNV